MISVLFALLVVGAVPEKPVLQAAEPSESFLDEVKTAPVPLERRWPRALGMMVFIGGATAAGIVALTRAQQRRGQLAPSEAIHLRAVRSLGGKQRIALVEVGGERLLLSTNDREVTLLTHLPQEPMADVAPATHMAQADAVVSPAFQAPTVAAVEAALDKNMHAPTKDAVFAPASFNADLAGLRQWQERAAQERRA